MSALSFLLLKPCGVLLFRPPQPRLQQLDLGRRRLDPVFRFLLKRMQNIHAPSQSHGVDGAVCVAVVIFDHLQHAGPAKAPQWFRVGVLFALLRLIDGVSHRPDDLFREGDQIVFGAADPHGRLVFGHQCHIALCLHGHEKQVSSNSLFPVKPFFLLNSVLREEPERACS
jgi:hypothetical protein